MMKEEIIHIYNEELGGTESIAVKKLSKNKYIACENALLICELTRNTEFTTKLTPEGSLEIDKITKKSELITRKLFLPIELKKSELEEIGEELIKIGGFWQVDFGGIAIVNYPKEVASLVEKFVKEFELKFFEITE